MGWFGFKSKKGGLNSGIISKETRKDIFIDESQIDYWIKNYNKNQQAISHPYVEIAQVYTNAALHEKASDFYQRFLSLHQDKRIHALYLQNLLLSQTSTNASLLIAHQAWANTYDDASRRKNWQKRFSKQQKRKLKIGYACHFFSNSISHNVLLPFLKYHDKEKFETYCYDDEGVAENIVKSADHWRDIRGMQDRDVANLIMKDGIDILQELNGFCIVNRFDALSYRPAPIQINWYNHTSTTGLSYIDYVMSDKVSIRDEDTTYFIERPYLTDNFIAAVNFVSEKFGKINEMPPCARNGFITFGYFGGSHKITLAAIKAWASVLKEVPHSRLYLKCGSFTHELYRKIYLNHFSETGIDSERILFEGWTDQQSTLTKYNDVDIMLDNMPVTGGSTFFEALMQGVPTVTLEGTRWAARSGASVLTSLHHTELIAKNVDEYVKIAADLAQDPTRLAYYRSILRHEMQTSTLTDVKHAYHNFEKAYFDMWQHWCAS